jgi:hypothetical protein
MKIRSRERGRPAARARALTVPDRTLERLLLMLAALTAAALLTGCVVVAGEDPLPAEAERTLEISLLPAAGESIRVRNLAGKVRVETVDGDEARVVATVHAGGADDAAAEELASTIELAAEQAAGIASFEVRYPVDRSRTFHYPREDGAATFFGYSFSRTEVDYQGESVTVVSRRDPGALSLWADLTVRVPAGVVVEIVNAAGDIEAERVDADLVVEAQSGDVSVLGGAGGARVATGSGDVHVEGRDAPIVVATGSGDVDVRGIDADVDVRTGSGDVTLAEVAAVTVRARTGSGDVEMSRVRGAADLATGSGDVEGVEMELLDMLMAHTGSGHIVLSGTGAGLAGADLETGSGDIELFLSDLPALSLRLHTSSGDIDTDLPDLQVVREDDEVLEGFTGEEPRAEIRIETSSGNVTLSSRR